MIRLDNRRLFVRGRSGTRALDLDREAARHAGVAHAGGERPALFKRLDRARYPAPAEQHAGLAENARVTLTFFGGIHDDR